MPRMLAGSIFGLEPGIEYECRFLLTDPVGVDGKTENIISVRTRPEPKPVEYGQSVPDYGLRR